MTLDEFHASLSGDAPDAGLGVALSALWHAARREWETAHRLVQDDPSGSAAWVHAHLHRIEGDLDNAAYWYRRAGRTPDNERPIDAEWRTIANELLSQLQPGNS